jgi:hypothetical protein
MEFVSRYRDILRVVGTVEPTRGGRGIQMSLPEESDEMNATYRISKIVYGDTESGKRYIETVSSKNGEFPTYGEASIPEILAFAYKAMRDMPESHYSQELCLLACSIKEDFDVA